MLEEVGIKRRFNRAKGKTNEIKKKNVVKPKINVYSNTKFREASERCKQSSKALDPSRTQADNQRQTAAVTKSPRNKFLHQSLISTPQANHLNTSGLTQENTQLKKLENDKVSEGFCHHKRPEVGSLKKETSLWFQQSNYWLRIFVG